MHEFTKEELKYIRDTMINIVEVYPDSELPYSIRDKIQSMIDNYCDHHWVTDPRLHFMSNPAKIKCACTKCPATRYIDIIDINEPEYCGHSGIKLENKNG